ncbi:unnamed protein product, partial [Musa acuminata subsp. burmannicoides]
QHSSIRKQQHRAATDNLLVSGEIITKTILIGLTKMEISALVLACGLRVGADGTYH